MYDVLGKMVTAKDSTRFTSLFLAADFADSVVNTALQCDGKETVKVVTILDCSAIAVGDSISLTYAPSATGKPRLVAITKN